jgi:membrane-associated phospholipid phosphatase
LPVNAYNSFVSSSDFVDLPHHNHFLDQFFKSITHLGEGWIFIPVLTMSLFIRYSLSLATMSMMLLHGLICWLCKHVLFAGNFPRPSAQLSHDLLYFVPGVETHAQHSFPSGHTATIFCFAVLAAMMMRHRAGSIVALLVGLVVGYSRIYLLQHFLIDVAAGALIGVGSAFSILYLFDRLQLPGWSSANVKLALPRA